MAVDNDNFSSKLHLRRYFLRKYHGAGTAKPFVFDACQATGQLWKALRTEFDVTYYGVDRVLMAGRLRIDDSARILATPGWAFDVVDIDTYGQPWPHWEQVLRNGRKDVTFFLTMGQHNNTPAPRSLLRLMGLGHLVEKLPEAMNMRLYERAVNGAFASALTQGWEIAEVIEATKGVRARYYGARLIRVR